MSVAKAYARAFYEAATESGLKGTDLDQAQDQFNEFANAISGSREARVALISPAVPAKVKAELVAKIAKTAKISPTVAQFLQLMARKERMSLIGEIAQALSEVRLEAEGAILGDLVSADPLAPADVEGLSKAFSQKLGKKVEFRTATDPDLLAGIKVVVNGVTYDGTLRSQLQRLRDRLVQGTSTTH